MNYQQTLDYLYTQLPMFSRIGAAAYKADLNNTIALCNSIGNPQHSFKSIHIAGTNGKGSVSHMLAAIFQTAGYKTGLYTSPHLYDFRERIKIDGEMVSEAFVTDFTARLQQTMEKIQPSFFEITVAMAFEYFANEAVDIAIIETGLGGRLDSTNVIIPELSIITNIGLDHMNLLGNTKELIAAEKAGIIKQGVPVVISEVLPETQPVFEAKAKEMNTRLTIASKQKWVADWQVKNNQLEVSVAAGELDDQHKNYTLDLGGVYQLKNLLAVLEAVEILQKKGWLIEQNHIEEALGKVKKLTGLHGRWEVIKQHPLVVLEVCHNEDGIKQMLQQVELTDYHTLHLVMGFVNDKEIENLLALFPKTAQYYFTKAQIPRALPEDALAAQAAALRLEGNSYPDVNTALQQVLAKAQNNDLVVVCGSIFVVAEVKKDAL